MKQKIKRNKMAKNRPKSVNKTNECNADEESFETLDSNDSITFKNTPKTVLINKTSK